MQIMLYGWVDIYTEILQNQILHVKIAWIMD